MKTNIKGGLIMGITGEKWIKVRSIIVRTDNDYILGRISGIMLVISKERCNRYAFWDYEDDPCKHLFHVPCNRWQYAKIKNTLESLYPGMCEFEP
jgi:hypothetical protein